MKRAERGGGNRREHQHAYARRATLQGSMSSSCVRDLGRDWAVVVAEKDCSFRQYTTGHKMGARGDR